MIFLKIELFLKQMGRLLVVVKICVLIVAVHVVLILRIRFSSEFVLKIDQYPVLCLES
jgi:hypothetical protein